MGYGETELHGTMVDDLKFNDYVYTVPQMDTIISNLPSGGGSLKAVWGPESYTNQYQYATNSNATSIGLKTASENPNMAIWFDPTNSVYEFRAVSGIPGPPGHDGVGNIQWAGDFTSGMYITNSNTWVSYNGSIWTRTPSDEPIYDEPTSDPPTPWSIVVQRGENGEPGVSPPASTDLQLTYWSTNLQYLTTNMLISYDGYLLVITNESAIVNPDYLPVVDRDVRPPYKALVWPGKDGTAMQVYTNASFIVEYDPLTPVAKGSLVVWQEYLWYAKVDYDPNGGENAVPPSEGPNWMIIGARGSRGPQGADGVGNLHYVGEWDPVRTNNFNDIVRYKREDDRYDWYRFISQVPAASGMFPYLNTNLWSQEITSGTDAKTIDWKIVDGTYVDSVKHSNELYRAPNGIVYYTKQEVPTGPNYAPGSQFSGGYWDIFVKDGTTVAGSNGVVWRGIWQQSDLYSPGDMVTYKFNDGNGLYIASENITNSIYQGEAPTDERFWIVVASGIKGDTGPMGPVNTITYITNFVTYDTVYSNCSFVTNISYITNDNTSTIYNSTDKSRIYNDVVFNPQHFSWNNDEFTFSLTESALGITSFKADNSASMKGEITLMHGSNITFNVDTGTKTITINSSDSLTSIPLVLFNGTTYDEIGNTEKLIFDSNTGFRIITNIVDDTTTNLIVSLGSAWTKLYDDDLNFESPTGEEPLRITTHSSDNKVKWNGTTNIVSTNGTEIVTNEVKVISIGTAGITKTPVPSGATTLAPIDTNTLANAYVFLDTTNSTDTTSAFYFGIPAGLKGETGPKGLNAAMRIGGYENVDPISSNEFGQAYVHITNEENNTYALYFGVPGGLKGTKGERGEDGVGLIPRGSYNSTNTYYTNDIIRFENATYYVNNTAPSIGIQNIPPNDSEHGSYWTLFLQDGQSVAGDATTLFTFDTNNNPTNYFGQVLVDTNTLSVVSTNIGGITYNSLTVVGGGSSWTPNSRIITIETDIVTSDDYLIWMNGTTNQTLSLPLLTNDVLTIIVRQLGNSSYTTIQQVGSSNNVTLYGAGDWIAIDWLGATTNWYWRN